MCVELTELSVLSVPLPAVKNMNVHDETSNTMMVNWVEVDGATGYVLQYRSINASEPQVEMEVRFFCRLIGLAERRSVGPDGERGLSS